MEIWLHQKLNYCEVLTSPEKFDIMRRKKIDRQESVKVNTTITCYVTPTSKSMSVSAKWAWVKGAV